MEEISEIDGVVVALVGILISLIFGAYSIFERLRIPGKISYFQFPGVNLSYFVKSDFSDFHFRYKRKNSDENLHLIKGYLFNDGLKEIDKNGSPIPISIRLPKGCVWLDIREVTLDKRQGKAKIEFKKENFSITPLLIRRGEYFVFEALVDSKEYGDDVGKLEEELGNLQLEHGITDVRSKIVSNTVSSVTLVVQKYRVRIAMSCYIITFCGMVLVGMIGDLPVSVFVIYAILSLFFWAILVFLLLKRKKTDYPAKILGAKLLGIVK